jgi:GT2 family glycosyltransferase
MNVVIVPVRVNVQMTRNCIQSLNAQDIADGVTLYLIDNGTDDGCGPWIRAQEGICVAYTKPKGLSTTWNRALHHCFDELHLPYVLSVNNDTVLRSDTYRLLVEDGGPFVTAVGVSRSDIFDEKVLVDPPRPHPDYSCFLMRREVWDTIGGFDESMVSWSSDCDHHVRMHRAGIDAHCVSVPFYHIASGTLKHVDPETHEQLCRQSDRDRATFKAKYGCLPGTEEYSRLFM